HGHSTAGHRTRLNAARWDRLPGQTPIPSDDSRLHLSAAALNAGSTHARPAESTGYPISLAGRACTPTSGAAETAALRTNRLCYRVRCQTSYIYTVRKAWPVAMDRIDQ